MVTGTKNFKTYLTGVIGMTNLDATRPGDRGDRLSAGHLHRGAGERVRAAAGDDPGQHRVVRRQQQSGQHRGSLGPRPGLQGPALPERPGNVGWIDWTPPGGGTSELICSIQTPNNPAIDLPSWQYVTETGNVNSAGVETALRAYDGEVVLIPQFDQTCGPGPHGTPDSSKPAINTPPNYGCPRWCTRRQRQQPVVSLAELRLLPDVQQRRRRLRQPGVPHGAYVNGNNRPNAIPATVRPRASPDGSSRSWDPAPSDRRRWRDDRHARRSGSSSSNDRVAPSRRSQGAATRVAALLCPGRALGRTFVRSLLGPSNDLCAMSPARCRWDAQGRRGQEE